MTQIKKIFLNGEKYLTNQNLTLFDLLVYFNLSHKLKFTNVY